MTSQGPSHVLPRIVRFLAVHMAFGLFVGIAFASVLILTNAAGLNDLLAGDTSPMLPMFVFYFMFALTFASVAMGIGVMTMPRQNAPTEKPKHSG